MSGLASRSIHRPGVKPQPVADQLAEPPSGDPAAQPGPGPSLPSPAAPQERELTRRRPLHLLSSLAPRLILRRNLKFCLWHHAPLLGL